MNNPAIETKNSQFGISPMAGYFLTDRWALGVAPNISFHKQESPNEKTKGNGYSFAPFARYYQSVGEKLSVFGEVNGISYSTSTSDKNTSDGSLFQNYSSRSVNLGLYTTWDCLFYYP
jgi:outer membrane protein